MLIKSDFIYEDNVPVAFETIHPVQFAVMEEGAFAKSWDSWKLYYFALREDRTLIFRINSRSNIIGKFDLTKCRITHFDVGATINPLVYKEHGITVNCHRNNIETSFRCILNEKQFKQFSEAVRHYIPDHTFEEELKQVTPKQTQLIPTGTRITQSVMRQAIADAMSNNEKMTSREKILRRRGAFGFLPVLFANDLVHGSW
jgi:hypothetical protein